MAACPAKHAASLIITPQPASSAHPPDEICLYTITTKPAEDRHALAVAVQKRPVAAVQSTDPQAQAAVSVFSDVPLEMAHTGPGLQLLLPP